MESQNWFMKNISKITLALAVIGAVTGTVGLIITSVTTHNFNNVKYYLKPNKERVYGDSIIWEHPDKNDFSLYFGNKPSIPSDIRWNGIYPDGYFDN